MAPNGYAYEVVGDGAQDLKCPVCKCLIRDCVELPCAHTMCKNCVDFISKQAETRDIETVCPTCETVYIMDWVKESKAMDRIIRNSVKIKCLQVQLGCKWQGDISTVADHENTCTYKTIDCTNAGCDAQIMRSNLGAHLQMCEYRDGECEYCKLELPLNTLKDHHNICDLCPMTCPNDGCSYELKRKELMEHLMRDCVYEEVECQFYDVGCKSKVKRTEMKEHLDQFVHGHMTLLFRNTKDLYKAHKETKIELEDAQDRLIKTTIVLKDFNERLIQTKRELESTKEELAGIKIEALEKKVAPKEPERKISAEQTNDINNNNMKPILEKKVSEATLERMQKKAPLKKKISPFAKPVAVEVEPQQGRKSPVKKRVSPINVRSDSDSSTPSPPPITSPGGRRSPNKRVSPVLKGGNTSPVPIMNRDSPEEPRSPTGGDIKRRQGAVKPILKRPSTPIQAIVDAMNSSSASEYPTHYHALMSTMETDRFYVANGDLLIKISTEGALRPYAVIYLQPWEERRKNVFYNMRNHKQTKHHSERVSIEAAQQVGIVKLLVNCSQNDTIASVVCTQQNTSFLPAFLDNWGYGFNVPAGLHRNAFFSQDYMLVRLRQRRPDMEDMLAGM